MIKDELKEIYNEKYGKTKITAYCTKKECNGIAGDLWCIIDGKICPYLMIGIEKVKE